MKAADASGRGLPSGPPRRCRRSRRAERGVEFLLAACGYTAVGILGGIFVLLAWQGSRAFHDISPGLFLTSFRWDPTSPVEPGYGILSLMVSSALVALGALVLAVPVGVGVAVYLAEFARPVVREVLRRAVDVLASVPSVVLGFVGIVVVGPWLARVLELPNGLTALNGALLLAVMVLPTVVTLSDEALRCVPREHRHASLALGADPWQTLACVTLPAAAPRIVAAVALALGRAIGETMIVLMGCGNAPVFPDGFLSPVRTMTATIAIELGETPPGTPHYGALFALGLVLFCISIGINWLTGRILKREKGAVR